MISEEKRSTRAHDSIRSDDPSRNDEIASLAPRDYEAAKKKLVRKINLRIKPCLFLVIVLK